MRTPIYTADLRDKHGFKRVAKKLQRSWPSAVPLKLSSAQEILSRGLGYHDLHDLQQSSDKFDCHAPVPTQSEIRDAISTSIFVFCRSRKITDIDDNKLSHLVTSLPLQELSVYQSVRQSQTSTLTAEELRKPSEDSNQAQLPESYQRRTQDVNQSDNMDLNRRFINQPIKLISEDGLKSIWEAVLRRGILRDQSLFAILLLGVRKNEVRLAKCGDFSCFDSQTSIHLRASKASTRLIKASLQPDSAAFIARYIQTSGISEGDYLFPSATDATLPMRADKMNKIIASYLREALGDDPQLSANTIRLSVGAMAFGVSKISLSQMTGHLSPLSLLPYLIGQKKPEE